MKVDTVTEITDYKIKRKKVTKQELGCKFIRIDLDKEDFNIFRSINEIFRDNKQLTKKTLINKTSTRLLRLEFESDNIIKSKAKKCIVKKILPDYITLSSFT